MKGYITARILLLTGATFIAVATTVLFGFKLKEVMGW